MLHTNTVNVPTSYKPRHEFLFLSPGPAPETRIRANRHSPPRPFVKTIAILVFDGVEELDFVGPLEVFGTTKRLKPDTLHIFTVAPTTHEVQCVNGLKIRPDYNYQSCPAFNILLVPGGQGSRREMKNPNTLTFVKQASNSSELVASVCTGALILAAAGLLDGKQATTHWAALDELKQFPKITVNHQRFIEQDKIITSAGISSGIDMALHLVRQLYSPDLSRQVAHRMEYEEQTLTAKS